MVKYFIFAFFALIISFVSARAQSVWYFGTGEAVNLTNGIAYNNGVKVIAGALDPSATAVNAPSGSMYISSSGTTYLKQDAGLTTNWLPLGIASTGSLTTINGQSGPNVNIASGSSGTDFNIAASSNTITLNIPTASASNRGLLTSSDYSAFLAKQDAITGGASTIVTSNLTANRALISNGSGKVAVSATTDTELGYVSGVTSAIQTQIDGKEPSITSGTTAQYWRGDKSFQTLDKAAVGLTDVDNTSDADKPISTATQAALDLKADATTVSSLTTTVDGKIDGVASSVDSEVVLFSGTTGKASKRATGSGYAKLTSGVLSASASVPTSDLSGQVALANGGTNKSMTAVNGGVVYTDADSQEVTAAGASNQVLRSNGAAAPTWSNRSISSKSQVSSAVTLEEIQVPNDQLTLVTGNKYLAETGNKNILSDASFEGSNASAVWSLALGSFIADNTPIDGLVNGLLTLSSQSLAFVQDSTLYQAQFADGVQGLASVRVRTSVTSTPIYVCYRQAGNSGSISNGCVQVQANGKWGLYKVPFILGATSNGIIVTSNGIAITGDIEVDDAFVGAVDLKQDVPVIQTQGYKHTAVSGTVSLTAGTSVGNGLYSVSGAALTALKTISLKTSLYGTLTSAAAGNFVNPSIAGAVNAAEISIATGAGQGLAGTASIDAILNAGDTLTYSVGTSGGTPTYYVSIVADTVNNTSVYSAQNADTDWQSCGHTTSDFTGFGTVTNIETQCKRDGGDLLMKGKFTSGTSTGVEARLALKLNNTSLTSKSTSVIPTVQKAGEITFSVNFSGSAGTLIEPSVTYITFGISSGSAAGLTKQTGSNVLSSGQTLTFTARIPINGWENSNIIIGSFNEVVTTPGIAKPIRFGSSISSAGVLTNNEGGKISSASCTSGVWTINLTGLSNAPSRCFIQMVDNSTNWTAPRGMLKSSSVVNFNTVTTAGSPTCGAIDFECSGSAP